MPFVASLGHHQGFLGLAEEEQGFSSPGTAAPGAVQAPCCQLEPCCLSPQALHRGGRRPDPGAQGRADCRAWEVSEGAGGGVAWGPPWGACSPPFSLQARGAAAEGRRVRQHVAAAAAGWGRGREQGAAHREAPRQQEGAVRRAGGSAVTPKQGSGSPWCWGTPAGGCGSVCAPGAAGTGLDTPLRLYPFGLLVCSSLNLVPPSSVPACSGQAQGSPGLRAGTGTRGGTACARGSPAALSLSPSRQHRGLQEAGSGAAGAQFVPPCCHPHRCAPIRPQLAAPSQQPRLQPAAPARPLCASCYAFYFLPSSTWTRFQHPSGPTPAAPPGRSGSSRESWRGSSTGRHRPPPGGCQDATPTRGSAPARGARGCCCSRGDALQHGWG